MMETTQRGKKKVNKRNNADKFSENIGPVKSMKDKMKTEKPTLLQSVDGVKSETNLDVEFKKEPVLNAPLCENESKNSNICSKTGDVNSLKPGLMESVAKIQDRPFIDPKPEIGSRPEDASEEEDLQSNLMSSKIKAEAMPPDGGMFAPDSNENLILGLCNQNAGGPPSQGPNMEQPGSGMQPGVQPLPSNVINKQPGTMEAQYMQQQSQIFVFTTVLANKSAESVLQGQYPSIIAYHCAQPGTKKYLEKHPLKLNQFHRQSSAQWLNNLAQIKQKTVFGGNAHMKGMGQMPMGPRGPMPGMPGPCDMPPQGPGTGPRPVAPNMQPPMTDLESISEPNDLPPGNREMGDPRHGDFPGGVNPMNPMNMWNQQQSNMNQNNMNYSGPMKNMDRDKPCVMNRPPPMVDNMNPNHFPGVSQLTLTGTKVPTENLTPQQRQHRAEQLATLRKMQEILFPENQAPPTDEFGNPRMVPGGGGPGGPGGGGGPGGPGGPGGGPGAPGPGNGGVGPPNPNADDPNRNNALDNNDMKNQICLKNVNNNSINSNSNANSSSNGNNNISNNSNSSGNSNGNNSNSSNNNNNGNNSNTGNNNSNNGNNINNSNSNTSSNNNNSGNNSNNGSPMNRLMGRSMNGQSNRSTPMDNPMNHGVVNPPNNVLDAPENMDSMQDQNSHMMQKMPPGNAFPSVAAQLEWQKHYQQFQEEQKKKKGSRTDSPVSRGCNKMQGPPPPYHQTARSASVPIPVPNSNPGSPSNTTSNLSLPSPRTASDLNSPSDLNKHVGTPGGSVKMGTCSPPNNQGSPSCSKLMSNNPDTPVSTSASQSPTPTPRKDPNQPGLEFSNKDLFSRSVSSLQQQKHPKQPNAPPNKEPNLMPVPSPQQIHYLNTFEGQELTIQKQPNTSLKETNINSPLNHAPLSETPKCKTPNGAANSPLPQVPETSPRFPQNIATSTSTTCTTPVSTQSQPSVLTSKDTTTVPSSPDTGGPSPCRSENLPLNPNGLNCPPNNKSMHFDPITSLAQMSQQLTNQAAPPCPGGGPMMSYNSSSMHMVGNMNHMEQHVGPVGPVGGGGGPMGPMGHENPPMDNMQFPPNNPIISCAGPMMDMSPGFMNTSSPKQGMGGNQPPPPPRCVGPFFGPGGPGFQKMMGPNAYNGMNVQVKASTPNTIQYLPARPNTNSPNANTRGPPSLEFLQRFTNPMNNVDSKVSFIPNCHTNAMDGVNSGGNPGMNCGGPPVGNPGGNMMPNSVSNMLLGGNMVLNPGPVGPLRGQLRAGPGGMMKVPPQMGGGGGGGGGPPVFPPGPGCDPMVMGNPPGNPGMFIQGSKSSPLGMPPDASQPLPPSMTQGSNFKNSPFVGPTVADPNYAQQFHNFQQQLYATNTRSHQMNQSYFLPK